MNRLRRLAPDLDVFLVIALSATLAILALVGVSSSSILAAGTLTTLSLVAYGLLHNRRAVEQLTPAIQFLTGSLGPPNAGSVVKPLDAHGSLEQFFAGSSDVFMAGITLFTRVNMIHPTFKAMLDEGCHFRVIILDKRSPLLPRIATAQRTTKAALVRQLDAAVALFRSLEDYARQSTVAGTFQLLAFDYAPSLTLMRTCSRKSGEISIHVELQPYGSDIWQRPVFRVERRDGQLYEYFERVCESLWNDAVQAMHP